MAGVPAVDSGTRCGCWWQPGGDVIMLEPVSAVGRAGALIRRRMHGVCTAASASPVPITTLPIRPTSQKTSNASALGSTSSFPNAHSPSITAMTRDLATPDPLAVAIQPPRDETPAERWAREQAEAHARRVSEQIDDQIKAEKMAMKKRKPPIKVLLLGQSESGKSTTVKSERFSVCSSRAGHDSEIKTSNLPTHTRRSWPNERHGAP